MKKQIIVTLMTIMGLSAYAQNRWNVYAAGSLTHDCGGYFYWNADGNTNFNWGGGAIVGGGYIGEDFQTGVIGGVAVETGNHVSYFFQTRYPLLEERWSTANITLSLGIKYSF